jgi:hypothetical protein
VKVGAGFLTNENSLPFLKNDFFNSYLWSSSKHLLRNVEGIYFEAT